MSTTYAPTVDWQFVWSQSQFATGKSGYKLSNVDFTVQSTNSQFYNQLGNMSVKKVCEKTDMTTGCNYWWGYTTQVNFQTALTSGNGVIQQYMILQGQDVLNPTGNYINFQCIYVNSTPVAANDIFLQDCGKTDISIMPAPTAPTANTWSYYVGDYTPYNLGSPTVQPDSAKSKAAPLVSYPVFAKCPNDQPQSNFFQSQNLVKNGAWFSHSCTNFRNGTDQATAVKTYTAGVEIKYKAGYRIWSGNTIVSSAQHSQLQIYIFTDAATALTMSIAASAIFALVF